jgi:hypothetical protein
MQLSLHGLDGVAAVAKQLQQTIITTQMSPAHNNEA